MKIAVAELKWFQFRERMTDWRKKRHEARLAGIERTEERSVRILQKRYGYTKEQATSELRKHYSKARLG
jgi:hypothetical protein